MNEYLDLLFRSVFTYIILIAMTRIMGRKQISQLTYFDYVVGITIGSIASVACVDKDVNVYEGLFSIIIWSVLTILISKINLKSIKIRLLIDSEPLLIMEKGKVIYKNMKKARYNMGDLLMQLRDKGIFNITDVEIAILEPDGKLSVLKKSEYNPLTAKDMNIKKPKNGLMVDLILNGHILHEHLQLIGKTEDWVLNELRTRNIDNIKDVVFVGIQADEQIYIVTKND